MTRGFTSKVLMIHLIVLVALSFSQQTSQPGRAEEPGREQEEQPEKEAPKPNNANKHYSVAVTVLTGQAQTESPVRGASVTIFVGDHRETIKTESDGKVSFKFDAPTKSATIRVVADHFIADQQQVTLASGENNYRVVLKKPDQP
jgi:hypothetical protein